MLKESEIKISIIVKDTDTSKCSLDCWYLSDFTKVNCYDIPNQCKLFKGAPLGLGNKRCSMCVDNFGL